MSATRNGSLRTASLLDEVLLQLGRALLTEVGLRSPLRVRVVKL